ncbi:MAG: hypothetical protein ACOY90_00850 [Candidatus Zhuqueibacterota bacterium]
MKDSEEKEKFIEWRAKGFSYDEIAKRLNKSKTTLIKWNRELSKEISNVSFYMCDSLIEKYKLSKQAKVEYLAEQIYKIKEALKEKDYKKLSVRDLISLLEKYENELHEEFKNITFFTGEKESLDLSNFKESLGEFEITVNLY